jgi:DNA replication protein DnaC
MKDPAQVWDDLAALMPHRGNTQASATCELALRAKPKVRHLPAKERAVNLIDTALRRVIRECVKGLAPWPLFVHGGVGVGKTCAALALLDLVAGHTSYYTATEWAERCGDAAHGRAWEKRGIDSVQVTTQILRERISSAALVVIDELGTRGDVSGFAYERVKEVIDLRHGKPLVVISNHDLDGITKLYDDRVADRLAAGTLVCLEGESRRMARP